MPSPAPLPAAVSFAYRCDRLLHWSRLGRVRRYLFAGLSVNALPTIPRGYACDWHDHDCDSVAAMFPDAISRQWRFRQHARCLIVSRDHIAMGGLWIVPERFDEDEVRATYRVGSELVWDLGLFIPEAHRASRAFAALWGGVREHLEAHRLRGSVSRISDYLDASLRSHSRMDARWLGSASFARIAGGQWCSSSLAAGAVSTAGPCFDFSGVDL